MHACTKLTTCTHIRCMWSFCVNLLYIQHPMDTPTHARSFSSLLQSFPHWRGEKLDSFATIVMAFMARAMCSIAMQLRVPYNEDSAVGNLSYQL